MREPKRDSSVAGMQPELAWRVGRLQCGIARATGVTLLLIETRRSLERQQWLYEAGRTRSSGIGVTPQRPMGLTVTSLQPGGSHHTPNEHGQAAAADFLWDHEDPWSDARPWYVIGEFCYELGLEWGGDWASRDLGHVQLRS